MRSAEASLRFAVACCAARIAPIERQPAIRFPGDLVKPLKVAVYSRLATRCRSQKRPDDCADGAIGLDSRPRHSIVPISDHDSERQLKPHPSSGALNYMIPKGIKA
jgi:hypothetical protein